MADEELELQGGSPQPEPMAGPGEQNGQSMQPQDGGETQPEVTLQDLHKQMQNFQREFGRVRGLQSQFDTLPKTIETTLSKRLEQMQKEQYLNSLTPEDRLGYQQQQEGQKALEQFFMKMLNEKAPGLLDRYGDFTKTFERMSGQLESQDYFDQVAEALGEDAPKAVPYITKMFNELKKQANSSDPQEADQAQKMRELYASNPHAAAMAAMRKMQAEVSGQANGLIDQRRQSAKNSAIVPRGGGFTKAPNRLSPAQMNDRKYLESIAANMDTAAYEKLLENSRA